MTVKKIDVLLQVTNREMYNLHIIILQNMRCIYVFFYQHHLKSTRVTALEGVRRLLMI